MHVDTAIPAEIPPTLLDYYVETGGIAHFLVLSLVLFAGVAIYAITKRRSNTFRILAACSLLPLIIGIHGSASGLQRFLHFMLQPGIDSAPWQTNLAECLNPLLAGTFLSALFLFLTIVIGLRPERESPDSPAHETSTK